MLRKGGTGQPVRGQRVRRAQVQPAVGPMWPSFDAPFPPPPRLCSAPLVTDQEKLEKLEAELAAVRHHIADMQALLADQ